MGLHVRRLSLQLVLQRRSDRQHHRRRYGHHDLDRQRDELSLAPLVPRIMFDVDMQLVVDINELAMYRRLNRTGHH